MIICPYCHKNWTPGHIKTEFKGIQIIGCPEYPILENPVMLYSASIGPAWDKETADLTNLKENMKRLLEDA